MRPDCPSTFIVVVFAALLTAVAGPWTSLQWPEQAAPAATAPVDASFGHRVAAAFPTAAAGFVAHASATGS